MRRDGLVTSAMCNGRNDNSKRGRQKKKFKLIDNIKIKGRSDFTDDRER